MFAVLPPGGRLVKHRDPYAGSLRYHLGLITPNNERCRIDIDGNTYYWRDGEHVVFDQTYIHWAENESNVHQLILFCDIKRPMHGWIAQAVNEFLCKYLMHSTATRNEENDPIGVLNRIFGLIYPMRARAKALRMVNRKLYYALKYTLFGSILFWFFV